MTDLIALEKDPRLFLYTSLTAGSSHIVTATSRLETILRANKIPFQAIDLATDEQAKKLWQRRGGKRKLPGLVKEGFVLGDLNEVEEWNEFGELRENIGPVPAGNAAPPKGGPVGVQTAPALSHNITAPTVTGAASKKMDVPATVTKSQGIALPGAAEIAARGKKAGDPAKGPMKVMAGLEKAKATNDSLEENKVNVESATKAEDAESSPAAAATSVPIRGGPAKIAATNTRMEEAKSNIEPAAKAEETKIDSEREKEVVTSQGQAEEDVPVANTAFKEPKIGEPPIEDAATSSEPAQKQIEDGTEKKEAGNVIDVPTSAAQTVQPAEATEQTDVEQRDDEQEEKKSKEATNEIEGDDIPEANAAATAPKIGELTTEEAAVREEKTA